MATQVDLAAQAAAHFQNVSEIFQSLSTALKSHTIPNTMMLSVYSTPDQVRAHFIGLWAKATKAGVDGLMALYKIPGDELPVKRL